MSERIDHAKESERHLRFMDENLHNEEFAFADLNAKEAQVHATLALVEQQRIANLIALSAWQEHGPNDGQIRIPSFKPDGTLRDDIREGLGL